MRQYSLLTLLALLPFLLLPLPTSSHPTLPSILSRQAADPTCSRGISAGGACCPRICGQCGGRGCGIRGREVNTACCIRQVFNTRPSCRVSAAPCRLNNTAPRTCQGRGDFRGSWSVSPVNSGQLIRRHEACAVMVNGLVVLLGGRGVNKGVSVYNPRTRVWSNRAGPGPGIELHHMQCVGTNGRVYVVSSWTGGFPFERNNDKIYIYNVAADQWSTRAGLPERRRRGGGAAILRQGVIYVVGGNRGGHGGHATTLGWMDGYDIARNRWITNLPPMPDGRDHTGGALVNGQLCVAGGRDGGSSNFFNENKESTWCYNFGNRTWVRKANFPTPRAGSSYGRTCDGRLIVAGGEGAGRAYANVDVFDGCSWKSSRAMTRARHGSGVATSNCRTCGQMFIPSGSGSQGGSPELMSTERFVPAGRRFVCTIY